MMIVSAVEDWVYPLYLHVFRLEASLSPRNGDLQEWKRAEKCLLALYSWVDFNEAQENPVQRQVLDINYFHLLQKCQKLW